MKRMNYPESYLFDFETLSSLVEELLKESKIEDYQDVLNNALSLEQLQLNIKAVSYTHLTLPTKA